MLVLMYRVVAVWMLLAAVLRVVLSLNTGVPVDALPAITGAFGLLALVVLVPRLIRGIRNRPKPPSGRMIAVPPGNRSRASTSSN